MATFTLDQVTQIITVELPDTSITCQEILNAIRDWEDELPNMNAAKVADGVGKDDLGGGVMTGITLKLLNWKIKFAAQSSPTVCTISGGNLIAVDENGDSMTPIESSTNVSVVIAQSTSASLIEGNGADLDAIADAVWDEPRLDHVEDSTFGKAVQFFYGIEGGRWQIVNNQMIYYAADNITEICRFNLYDADGQPTMKNVFERYRV